MLIDLHAHSLPVQGLRPGSARGAGAGRAVRPGRRGLHRDQHPGRLRRAVRARREVQGEGLRGARARSPTRASTCASSRSRSWRPSRCRCGAATARSPGAPPSACPRCSSLGAAIVAARPYDRDSPNPADGLCPLAGRAAVRGGGLQRPGEADVQRSRRGGRRDAQAAVHRRQRRPGLPGRGGLWRHLLQEAHPDAGAARGRAAGRGLLPRHGGRAAPSHPPG